MLVRCLPITQVDSFIILSGIPSGPVIFLVSRRLIGIFISSCFASGKLYFLGLEIFFPNLINTCMVFTINICMTNTCMVLWFFSTEAMSFALSLSPVVITPDFWKILGWFVDMTNLTVSFYEICQIKSITQVRVVYFSIWCSGLRLQWAWYHIRWQ